MRQLYLYFFVHGRFMAQDTTVHEMKYHDVKNLHGYIEDLYHDCVWDAPEGWTDNGFLKENAPITVSVQYGQNWDICGWGTEEEEGSHWHWLHNYSHIQTMAILWLLILSKILQSHVSIRQKRMGGHWIDSLLEEQGDNIYNLLDLAK